MRKTKTIPEERTLRLRDRVKAMPLVPTTVFLECLLMPDGEMVICGHRVGWFHDIGRYARNVSVE